MPARADGRGMRVAVLGAGMQGVCIALELADRGVDVELIDRAGDLMTGSATANEGKIHLGYVYGADRSLDTARRMIDGAMVFAPLIRRWIGSALDDVSLSSGFIYAVHRDSQLTSEEVESHLSCCTEMIAKASARPGSDYSGKTVSRPSALSASERATIFDPEFIVAQGARFVAETLSSILSQRGVELIVRISVDGADAESADVCSKFISDGRCELTVQPERLGWVSNISWLLERAEGDYVCIQPHDDLITEDYLSSLLRVAERAPAASVVYSDIDLFGEGEGKITQPSVTGSPLARQLVLLLDHWSAVAFRGLTRLRAVREAGPLSGSPFRNFAADTVWMAQLAKTGELHRVPLPLYRKRLYPDSTHRAWFRWTREEKLSAWGQHCADMLTEALGVHDLDASKRVMLARAALVRSVSAMAFSRDGPFSIASVGRWL